jgi:hypothetical protein
LAIEGESRLIIYGWKQYVQVLAVLQLVCGQCGNTAEQVLRKLTTKFTLFWIPLFPINRKRTLFCPACDSEQKVTKEQAMHLAAGGAPQQPAGPHYGGRPVYGPGQPFAPPGSPHQPGPVPGYGLASAPPQAFGPPPGPWQPGPGPAFGPPPGHAPQPAFGSPQGLAPQPFRQQYPQQYPQQPVQGPPPGHPQHGHPPAGYPRY